MRTFRTFSSKLYNNGVLENFETIFSIFVNISLIINDMMTYLPGIFGSERRTTLVCSVSDSRGVVVVVIGREGGGLYCNTVHFGYSGHLAWATPFWPLYLIGHYIQPEYNRTNVFCTRKSGHYIRMATINVATISGVHCITKSTRGNDRVLYVFYLHGISVIRNLVYST